jgi:hypothetical protein
MSVVLVTPDRYEAIRKTMEHLRAQTVSDQLEIVIVGPAKTDHVNISLLSSYVRAEFNGARMFAANRVRSSRWPMFWRLFYISKMPLIPFVRLQRVVRQIFRSGRGRELLPRILPALIVGLVADAFGQLTGYTFGAGNAAQRRVSFELNRCQHVTEQDGARGILPLETC